MKTRLTLIGTMVVACAAIQLTAMPTKEETKANVATKNKSTVSASVSGREESTTEKTRKDIAKLFPGWSLDSEVPQESKKGRASGFCANHRGQDNVLRLHPVNIETPVVLSRTVSLSNKNPCLFLKVSSWDEKSDFFLSVRVNGKGVMSQRLVRTSDLEPWEDLVVPLFDWRGRSVKIEIILSANNWWCEWSHLARIEIAEGNGQETKKEQREKQLYMIVDLMKSGKMAVSYLDEVPKGGWSDEYRKTKIALRKIAPGSFEYLPGKSFKITKPFYIGVFEVTQNQYEKVMGHKNNRSKFKGNMRPVENVSYIDIRGLEKGQGWPKDGAVDDKSYLGKLRKKVGIDFDLPTEVQWEYACRAGTKGEFNVDGVEMVKLGKCRDNGGQKGKHAKVGSFMPNAWGLYDMHGNVWEWCVDRGNTSSGFSFFNWNSEPKETETDPKGPMVGPSRVLRSGSWVHGPGNCSSSLRCRVDPGCRGDDVGFRLVCPAGVQ